MTTDAEIIEAMARELSSNDEKYRHIPWVYLAPRVQEMFRSDARAAFAICAPAIRAQAMEEAARLREAATQAAKYLDAIERNMKANDVDMALDECVPPSLIAEILREALAPPAVAEKGSK